MPAAVLVLCSFPLVVQSGRGFFRSSRKRILASDRCVAGSKPNADNLLSLVVCWKPKVPAVTIPTPDAFHGCNLEAWPLLAYCSCEPPNSAGCGRPLTHGLTTNSVDFNYVLMASYGLRLSNMILFFFLMQD
jgi:hypothetical protein